MSIAISEIRRVFRYNGMQLPDVPGLDPREVRDLYSAQYPELVSAEIEASEVRDGVREYTFRKAVGTKGGAGAESGRLAALNATVQAESAGRTDASGKLARAMTRRGTVERGSAWGAFVRAPCGRRPSGAFPACCRRATCSRRCHDDGADPAAHRPAGAARGGTEAAGRR